MTETIPTSSDTCPDCLLRRDGCVCIVLDRASAARAPAMDRDDSITRAQVEARWREAKRAADANGVGILTPAAAAGQYLEASNGDVFVAYALVPPAAGRFWTRVRGILARF